MLYKSKQLVFEKNSFRLLFYVIITNEVPVTILQAYLSLSRHIRKGVLIRQNIAPDLYGTAVGCQQFRKESRKRQRMFERIIIPFSIIAVVLSLRNVPKTVF